MSDRLHRLAAAVAVAFDRLQARLFDAPWQRSRNPGGRIC